MSRQPRALLSVCREANGILKPLFPEAYRKRGGSRERRPCYVCGIGTERERQRAHIVSIEEDPRLARDRRNVLPLCTGGSRDLSSLLKKSRGKAVSFEEWIRRSKIGCHELYDEGLIPRYAIQIAKAMGGRRVDLTRNFREGIGWDRIESEYGSTRGLQAAAEEEWRRYQGYKRRRARACVEVAFQHACDAIKYQRRRAKEDAVDKAADWADETVADVQRVWRTPSPGVRQRLYYEAGLASEAARMRRVPDDSKRRARRARNLLDLSRKSCSKAGLTEQEWISDAELFLAEILQAGRQGRFDRKRIDSRFSNLSLRLRTLRRLPNRWQINWLLHAAKYHFLCADYKSAKRCINRVRRARGKLTVASGLTLMQRVHINQIEGMCLARSGKYKDGGILLARAMSSMAGGRGKRPEGVVDALRALAFVLEQLWGEKMRRDAARLRSLAGTVDDGRSGVWSEVDVSGQEAGG